MPRGTLPEWILNARPLSAAGTTGLRSMRPEIPQHGLGHNATPAATATAPPGSPREASPAATEPSHRGRTGRRSGCADSVLFVHRVSGLLGKRGQENVRLGNGQIHARFPGQNVVESDKCKSNGCSLRKNNSHSYCNKKYQAMDGR